MNDFDHILNWRLLHGSHRFPGPDGGTCINEAAIVACGFPYQHVGSVGGMPVCFSRPICELAQRLNDEATDADRQRLLPFVTRLACADTPEIERERARYIDEHLGLDRLFSRDLHFDRGLTVLEGVLAIGRRADPLDLDVAAARLDAVRGVAGLPARKGPTSMPAKSMPAKMKAWLGLPQALDDAV